MALTTTQMYDSYMKDIPISTARETLAEVIETIHRTSEPVGLTRRGRRVAVLVDAEVFERLTQDAEDALDRAAASLDPGLRYKALYNLGVASLQQSRQNAAVREEREAEATARFRQARSASASVRMPASRSFLRWCESVDAATSSRS